MSNRVNPRQVSTSIVQLKPLTKDDADKYIHNNSTKLHLFINLLHSFCNEFLARCLLLFISGFAYWRLILTIGGSYPEWVYVLISCGAFMSLVDCFVSLYYYFQLPTYWKCYSYIHWRGRRWFDLNTFYCLLTICPAVCFTEMVIFNNANCTTARFNCLQNYLVCLTAFVIVWFQI